MVLPLTLMVLLVLAALISALLGLGVAEPQIAANLLYGHQALDLAEAGAERAIAAFVTNRTPVDDALCAPCPGASTTLWTSQNLSGTAAKEIGTYTVTSQPVGFRMLQVVSTGQTSIASARRTTRAVVTTLFDTNEAILADRISLDGNARVSGSLGSAHGNTTAAIGGSAWVDQTITTHGATCSGCGDPQADGKYVGDPAGSGPNKPVQDIPPIDPMALKPYADFILQDDGTILIVATAQVVTDDGHGNFPGGFSGWNMVATGKWKFTGSGTPSNGTYYAAQEIIIGSSPGSSTPWQATFVVGTGPGSGEVDIEGHPTIVPAGNPHFPDVVMIAGHEVSLHGTGGDASLTGAVLCAGEVEISGSVSLTGNVIAGGGVSASGSMTITYNSKTKTPLPGPVKVLSWSSS